jgi:hypothetical protein
MLHMEFSGCCDIVTPMGQQSTPRSKIHFYLLMVWSLFPMLDLTCRMSTPHSSLPWSINGMLYLDHEILVTTHSSFFYSSQTIPCWYHESNSFLFPTCRAIRRYWKRCWRRNGYVSRVSMSLDDSWSFLNFDHCYNHYTLYHSILSKCIMTDTSPCIK